MRLLPLTITLATLASTAVTVRAQSTAPATTEPRRMSIALESDVLSFGLKGYSGILSVSMPNGLMVAFGTGAYEVPEFLLSGEKNWDAAHWKARSTSVQVLRATYRFNGPMKSGPALGGVILNQNWKLSAEKLTGETKFQPVSTGVTGGYYFYIGKHFYVYPTVAFTYNRVASGKAELQGVQYNVAKWAPNGSLHMGWEWSR